MNFFQGRTFRIFFLIGVAFFLCEMTFRIRAKHRFGQAKNSMVIDDPVEGRSLTPNFVSKGALRTVTINEFGFRGNSIPELPQPGTLRITCLGSSSVFCGMTNSDGDTFPAQMEQELNAHFGQEKVEVINAGIPGMSTTTVILHLKKRVERLKPQLAIFYPPPNDLGIIIKSSNDGVAATPHFLRRWRSKNSVAYDALRDKVRLLSLSVDTGQFRHFPENGKEVLKKDYRLLVDECRRANIDLVFVVHSFAFRREQSPQQQQQMLYGDFWGLGLMGALEATEAMNSATREVAQEEGIPCIDAEFCVPGEKKYYEDALHLTPAGNAILGKTVADELLKQGIIDHWISQNQ